MRRPVTGEVHVHYAQIYVESDLDIGTPGLSEAFAGQEGGLCGGAVPGALYLITGLHTGAVGFVVEVHEEAPPPPGPVWEDVVEVSFRPASEETRLVEWAGQDAWDLDLAVTDYRVRYCARGMDAGRERDTRPAGEPQVDSYLLQFWPAPPAPDRVVRQASKNAAYRHRHARELPPPPTPEQRAEAERLAREAEERVARERQLHYERWAWGGRLPSEKLRGVGGNVWGLLRFDSDLVHALDGAGPEVQRTVALLAARRACEAAGLTGLPWVAGALTALAARQPLPPPFDHEERMREALTSDPRVPDRTARPATPPERPPYRPTTPPPNGRIRQPAARAVPKEAADREAAASALQRVRATGIPDTPPLISQPHFALPAVLAAAEPDPLRAALDAVWHAANTYGEHYPDLLAEVRAAVPGS